jgi:hypothetical protein
MSHGRERHEKNCLNCGTTVQGRFCQHCGQENIEPKENFWQLLNHFFNDVTHFDGKFLPSLKYVLSMPGFLPKEYVKGRRASYLNPVRMYIFTSAIFFLLFFSFINKNEDMITSMTLNGKTPQQVMAMDSARFAVFTANINKNNEKDSVPMTRDEFQQYVDSIKGTVGITISGSSSRYSSKEEYDSLLKAGVIKHSWIRRQFVYKEIAINKKYNNDSKQILNALRETFIHSIPQMLFVSLPLLALILKLVYVRRRKEFYYISHLIFGAYLYIFIFLLLLLIFGLGGLNSSLHWGSIKALQTILIIGIFVYEYLALYKFYRQGWFKTFVKFLLINILFAIMILLLFVIFGALSLFKI